MPRSVSSLVILAAAALAACAANPKPGEPGYPYNLSGPYQAVFLVEGTPYRGTMALSTAQGGVVSGNLTVIDPVRVVGTVEGMIVADTIRFEMPYEILDNGCAGTVGGAAPVAAGGGGFDGPVQLDDSCSGALSGTITVTRQ